ncbi:MAG: hypothetical protein NAG76_10280 [Candidatus Pristimantibacillus lignocellulolyticus]|uniref:Uncharacterized protein n=1 Tax=Candidatus Pristimantibacillus lignocellulolyticus TaxID=2994561 RepID=A0A9J6ZL46_9BACL|nr:MAG: hypothetical protein NAG76_10280 [Candidatus Pristimantibacillus lignocellulolyticus]
MFKYNTNILIENKLDQINASLQKVFNSERIEILSVICDDIGYATPNFTTAGIYHLHGNVILEGKPMPWSIILKIIKADSSEKELSSHHNYWRREALVFESKLLDDLPDSIQAPKCYLIEEQQDQTIWMWIKHMISWEKLGYRVKGHKIKSDRTHRDDDLTQYNYYISISNGEDTKEFGGITIFGNNAGLFHNIGGGFHDAEQTSPKLSSFFQAFNISD